MPEQARLSDSPWFWLLAFSMMALVALAAMSGKYGRRQAAIERQFQAREHVAQKEIEREAAANADRKPIYATPGDNLVPLWPLAAIMLAIAALAATMLMRARRHSDMSSEESAPR